MRHLSSALFSCGAALLILGAAGCSTVRHPSIYAAGRPEWTFDVSQIDDTVDLPATFSNRTGEYYFFLGIASVSSRTEETARMGAVLNAREQAKMFLHSYGATELKHEIRRSSTSDILRFQAVLDDTAGAEVAHLQPVRWYMEEHRAFFRAFWPFRDDTRSSRWRAWCVCAMPRETCHTIIQDALDKFRDVIVLRADEKIEVTAPAEAEESSDGELHSIVRTEADRQPEATRLSYGDRALQSAYLGVANILCGPVEPINQPFVIARKYGDDNELMRFGGFLIGIPVGVVKGALRIVYGAGSLAVAPLGLSMLPIVSPEKPRLVPPLVWDEGA